MTSWYVPGMYLVCFINVPNDHVPGMYLVDSRTMVTVH